MKCKQVKKQFSGYRNRALSLKEVKEVSHHLDQCERCKHQFEVLQVKRQLLLATLPDEEVFLAPDAVSKLKDRLMDIPPPTLPNFWEFAHMFARRFSLAVLVLLLIIIGINTHMRIDARIGRPDFITSIAEQNFSRNERILWVEGKELTSGNLVDVLMSDGETK